MSLRGAANAGTRQSRGARVLFAACAALALLAPTADARITRIVWDRVESPTFGGAAFGTAGQYEKLVGRAYGELDPKDAANRDIVYLAIFPARATGCWSRRLTRTATTSRACAR